jgi:Flp pilus assembly pilin Flp
MSEFFTGLWVRVSNVLYREQGQALTEYALVLSILAAIAALTAFTGIGQTIVDKITNEIKAIK